MRKPFREGQAPPPTRARPCCIGCGKALKPQVLQYRDPDFRVWDGYEGYGRSTIDGEPLFCTLICALNFATCVANSGQLTTARLDKRRRNSVATIDAQVRRGP